MKHARWSDAFWYGPARDFTSETKLKRQNNENHMQPKPPRRRARGRVQREENYDQLAERADWFYEAITASYALITKTPGVGSIYLSTYRDKDGGWLDGASSCSLRISPNTPMKKFRAVSVYDMDSRTLFRNESLKAEVSSRSEGLQTNADASVDVYFGPQAPSGKESNWVQTVPGQILVPLLPPLCADRSVLRQQLAAAGHRESESAKEVDEKMK